MSPLVEFNVPQCLLHDNENKERGCIVKFCLVLVFWVLRQNLFVTKNLTNYILTSFVFIRQYNCYDIAQYFTFIKIFCRLGIHRNLSDLYYCNKNTCDFHFNTFVYFHLLGNYFVLLTPYFKYHAFCSCLLKQLLHKNVVMKEK